MDNQQNQPTGPQIDGAEEPGYDIRIGQVMQKFRKALGITQEELAADVASLGLPFRQQTIVKIENGSRPLRLQEAEIISRALGVEIADLTEQTFYDNTAVLMRLIRDLQAAREAVAAGVRAFEAHKEGIEEILSEGLAAEAVLSQAEGVIAMDVRTTASIAHKEALAARKWDQERGED